jgi:hypothetical protein
MAIEPIGFDAELLRSFLDLQESVSVLRPMVLDDHPRALQIVAVEQIERGDRLCL